MKPGGKFHMTDLDRVGGVPVVLKHLLEEGLLHGDEMTVTGKTMAENLAEIDPPAPDGTVVYPISQPINAEGGLNVLTGSLAPSGSVVKVAGLTEDQRVFEGPARVFDGEDGAMAAVMGGEIEPGTVIVIRYEGPKGGPGMREMLAITGALKGVGRGADCALITDGRFSGGTWGSALDTSHPRRSMADRSPSCKMATAFGSTCRRLDLIFLWTTMNLLAVARVGRPLSLVIPPASLANTPALLKVRKRVPSRTRCEPLNRVEHLDQVARP